MQGAAGFPRLARLLRPAEFRRVFACRSVRQNALFRIHAAAPSESGDPTAARLGLAIARRAVRHAHARNRIKRQVREMFRLRRDRIRPGDYVVTANPAAAGASPAELRTALDHLWRRFELK